MDSSPQRWHTLTRVRFRMLLHIGMTSLHWWTQYVLHSILVIRYIKSLIILHTKKNKNQRVAPIVTCRFNLALRSNTSTTAGQLGSAAIFKYTSLFKRTNILKSDMSEMTDNNQSAAKKLHKLDTDASKRQWTLKRTLRNTLKENYANFTTPTTVYSLQLVLPNQPV